MGYSTNFSGELKFASELTASQLAAVSAMLGEDVRDHPEWGKFDLVGYIDLELLPDFSGLKWDGAEKTYGLEHSVNVITEQMRMQWPEFRLIGQLNAQGEDVEDRWSLVMDDAGTAHKRPIAIVGQRVTCPNCDHTFLLESK